MLPKDTPPAELRELALELAMELRKADRALSGLGSTQSGATAISDSEYLASVARGGGPASGSDDIFLGHGDEFERDINLSLFRKKIRSKTFMLRAGIWTDRVLLNRKPQDKRKPLSVAAFSDGYFELLRKLPALAPYFAFSTRLLVEYEGQLYEVRPAENESESKTGKGDK